MKSKEDKLKGKISPRLLKVPIFDPFEVEVDVSIDIFSPVIRSDGGFDLLVNAAKDANGTYKHTITSRVIQFIDCGFSLTLPNGYRLVVEGLSDHLAKGLVIHPAFSGEGKQRIALFAHNLGKEIIVLNQGDSIGRMYLTSLYKAKIKGHK